MVETKDIKNVDIEMKFHYIIWISENDFDDHGIYNQASIPFHPLPYGEGIVQNVVTSNEGHMSWFFYFKIIGFSYRDRNFGQYFTKYIQ